MKGATTPAGYTIVEVMIVLAVSGVMFLIAANFISGRQESTSFPQGVNALASNLQNTIEQVTDGQYSDIDFTCHFVYNGLASSLHIGAGLEQTTTNSTTGDTQGTQSDCIFLGKVVQFNENDGKGDDPTQQYETFTIAGGRLDNDDEPITADTANPTTPLDNDAPTAVTPYLTVESIVPQHLSIIGMGVEPTTNEPTIFPTNSYNPTSYGLGFIENLGSTANPGTQNGAQPINLYYVKGWNIAQTQSSAQSTINGDSLTPVTTGNQMVMCVTDQTKYAYIEVGSANSQLEVRVRMLGATPCT